MEMSFCRVSVMAFVEISLFDSTWKLAIKTSGSA